MSNSLDNQAPVIFLMGPTASGKTELAIELSQYLPVDIISVDSAMIYRYMDIGTAKPSAEELAQAPHALIDICDPSEVYSAADFCRDARREIEMSHQRARIPLLVGGTMMYFKALLEGMADMPATDEATKLSIEAEAQQKGWPALHAELAAVDPDYAAQVHPNHSQRIGRGLAVYRISGQTMTAYRQQQQCNADSVLTDEYEVMQFAIMPQQREWLHQRIALRFEQMLNTGFIAEVEALRHRDDLHADLPAIRAVGYRQVWRYLQGEYTHAEMIEKAVIATRQLAKRQMTWLRGWPEVRLLDVPLNDGGKEGVLKKNIKNVLKFAQKKSI